MTKKKSSAEKLKTRREWYRKNREKELARKKQDYEEHKDTRADTMSNYYQRNKKTILKRSAVYLSLIHI